MNLSSRSALARTIVLSTLFTLPGFTVDAQQIVQRGAQGAPSLVMDETAEWTTPLLLVQDRNVAIYMPDVTSSVWLERNYPEYRRSGTYVLSLFTFYRTPEACRVNQTNWGLADAKHLDACLATGYRIRRALVDPPQKAATLLMAAMVDTTGKIVPETTQKEQVFHYWYQLDENTRAALEKAYILIREQLKLYERKLESAH